MYACRYEVLNTVNPLQIAAVEKQKFVYVLNRDSANKLTISSPLEAHKNRHIVYALAALDNGFDNPIFAAIELDYTDADQDPTGDAAAEAEKQLVFYELVRLLFSLFRTLTVAVSWLSGVGNRLVMSILTTSQVFFKMKPNYFWIL